ncbi:MAG: nucleoside triphosphate pyrophosphohydrolase, partial [Flavobacteriaceae bacterium]|nr:nucleoside triphosphate pyrophosphohydrolase [Flavobacteriaceae bacterium]
KMEAELGDVFFALINYARFINISPENALERTNKEFIRRFQFIENEAEKIGKKLTEMTLEEMDFFWNQAKK